jgi:hypothetical protein
MPVKYYYGDSSKKRTEKLLKKREPVERAKDKTMATASSATRSMAASPTVSSPIMSEKMEIDASATLESLPESRQEEAEAGRIRVEDELAAPYEIVERRSRLP